MAFDYKFISTLDSCFIFLLCFLLILLPSILWLFISQFKYILGYSGMNFLNQWVEKTSIFLGRRNYARSQGTPGQSLTKSSVLHLSSETLLLLTSKKTTSLLRALNPIAFPSLQCSLHVVDVFSAQFFPEQLPWPGRCTWLPFSFLSLPMIPQL